MRAFHSLLIPLAALLVLAPAQAQKKRVAVLDFEYAAVHDSASALFGTRVDVGKGIRDLLVEKLVQGNVYSVIDRSAMDKILTEQNFSNSDRVNPASAAKLGQVLGVDAIIIGSITQFGRDDQSTTIGGGGFGGFGSKLGLGGIKKRNAKAAVGITARLIDINTAEILAATTAKGESKREGTSLVGAGAGGGSGGAGVYDFTSSNFGETLIGEATHEAVNGLKGQLEQGSNNIVTRKIAVEGLVADASGNTLILTGLVSGLGQSLLGLTSIVYLAFPAAMLMGGAQAAFMTMTQTVTQASAADEFRGRVASINTVALGGMMAILNLVNGSLADRLGAHTLLFWEGLIFAGIVLLSLFAVTGRRVYGRMPAMEAQPA